MNDFKGRHFGGEIGSARGASGNRRSYRNTAGTQSVTAILKR